jgi:hypothetical protein
MKNVRYGIRDNFFNYTSFRIVWNNHYDKHRIKIEKIDWIASWFTSLDNLVPTIWDNHANPSPQQFNNAYNLLESL